MTEVLRRIASNRPAQIFGMYLGLLTANIALKGLVNSNPFFYGNSFINYMAFHSGDFAPMLEITAATYYGLTRRRQTTHFYDYLLAGVAGVAGSLVAENPILNGFASTMLPRSIVGFPDANDLPFAFAGVGIGQLYNAVTGARRHNDR